MISRVNPDGVPLHVSRLKVACTYGAARCNYIRNRLRGIDPRRTAIVADVG